MVLLGIVSKIQLKYSIKELLDYKVKYTTVTMTHGVLK